MDRQAAVTWSHQMGLNPFIHKTDSLKTQCFHDTLPISLSLSLPSRKMLSWCFKKSTLTLEVIVHKPRDLVLWSICQNVKLYRFHPCSFGAPWETTLLRSTSKGSQKKVPIPRVIPKNSPTVQWIASKLSRSYSLPSKIQQQQSEPTIVTGSPSLPSGHPPIISCHCHIYPQPRAMTALATRRHYQRFSFSNCHLVPSSSSSSSSSSPLSILSSCFAIFHTNHETVTNWSSRPKTYQYFATCS